MIRVFILTFLVLENIVAFSQKINIIQKSLYNDSSYYDICKINDNECWIGGENGILKSIDTTGIIKDISYTGKKETILSIKKSEKYIYLSADKGVLYIYDIDKKTFTKKKFKGRLSKSCFYDMLVLKDGSILICGGNTKLLKKIKSWPKGFIIHLDSQCKNCPEYTWKSINGFATSLSKIADNEEIYASIIYYFKSKIYRSKNNGGKWKKFRNFPFFIYAISHIESELWFCGSTDRKFLKDAITGNLNSVFILKNNASIWNLLNMEKYIFFFSRKGEILYLDKRTNKVNTLDNNSHVPLYKSVKYNSNKAYIIGHGGVVLQIILDNDIHN